MSTEMKKEEVLVTFERTVRVEARKNASNEEVMELAVNVANEADLDDMMVTQEGVVQIHNENRPEDSYVSAAATLLSRRQIDYLRDHVNYEISFAEKELLAEERSSLLAFLNPLQVILSRALESAVKRKYLVVICTEYVRDTQIAMNSEADPSKTDGWKNTSGEHVLGLFEAENASEAIKRAALVCEMSEEVLGAYELGGIGTRMSAV